MIKKTIKYLELHKSDIKAIFYASNLDGYIYYQKILEGVKDGRIELCDLIELLEGK